MLKLLLFILFFVQYINLIKSNNIEYPIYQLDYDHLLEIRESFQEIKNFFNQIDPTTQLYPFCNPNNYFNCIYQEIDGNSYYVVNKFVIRGQIGTNICPDFNQFYNPQQLILSNMDCSGFNFSVIPNISLLTCNYCNLNTWQDIFNNITTLSLTNNPLETTIRISQLTSKNMELYNTGVYANYFIRIINDIVFPTGYYKLEIMLCDNSLVRDFLSIQNFTIHISNNATDIDFNLLVNFGAISFLIVAENPFTTNFPLSDSVYQFTQTLQTLNINFLPVLEPIDFLNSKLSSLIILKSPNFNINGKSPLKNVNSLKAISLENCGLIEVPEFFDSNIISISLHNNLISGPLPSISNNNSTLGRILSNNSFTGTIPSNYCFFSLIRLENNQLNGVLPSCFSCYLNSPSILKSISGNSFSNYIDGSNDFPPCNTISVSTVSSIMISELLIVNGTDFPRNGVFPTLDPPSNSPIKIQIPSSSISVLVTSDYFRLISGRDNITLNFNDVNQTKSIIPIKFYPPTINSIVKGTTLNGYTFIFMGRSLFKTSSIIIKFDNLYNCIRNSYGIDGYEFGCDINTLNMVEKTYQIHILIDNKYNFTMGYVFTRTFPIISAIKPVSSNGGIISIYGYFGLEPIDIDITMKETNNGIQSCVLVDVKSTIITCDLSKIVLVGTIVATIYTNNGSLSADYPYYSKELSRTCYSPCINGFCEISGNCLCYKGFAGPTCNSVAGNSEIIIKENSTTISQDNINFEISIRSIKEISYNSNIIKEIFLKNWQLSKRTDPDTWNYYIKLGNTTTVSYSVFRAPFDMNVTFAGINVKLVKDSIKISVNISKWEYSSSLNVLELTMTSNVNADSECETNIDSQTNEMSTVNYFTIEKDGKILYGKFIDQMLSDGIPTYSPTKILSKNKDEIIVGISMPHCNECILDPDFSVLVQPNSECSTKSKKAWLVPTVVVVCVVGGCSLLIMLIYILKKNQIVLIGKSQIVIFNKTFRY